MEKPKETTEQGQVKSRARVRDHGEVFTAEREVKAMCDLVRDDSFNPDSTFLEPACGTGNFLLEILSRKLVTVSARYRRRPFDWETHSLQTLGSLYGVDILGDNVAECRERLFEVWDAEYARLFKSGKDEGVRKSARFILDRNIVRGNALSMKLVDGEAKDTDEPIVFSQWKLHSGGTKMRREDFSFAHLLENAEEARATVPDAVPGGGRSRLPQNPADRSRLSQNPAPGEQLELFAVPPQEPSSATSGCGPGSAAGGCGRLLFSKLYPSRRVFDE